MSDAARRQLERLADLTPRGAFRVVGVKGRFDQSNMGQVPALWGRLIPRLPIPGRRHGTLGLIISEGPAAFVYMAGVEMEDGAPVPEGLDVVEVPAQTYAVWRLTTDGEALHPQMQAALGEIWGRGIGAAGLRPTNGPNFELYPPYFDQQKAGETVEFWIPVEA